MFSLMNLREKTRRFFTNEEGASAIEYSIIAALIAVVMVSGAKAVGTDVGQVFTKVSTALKDTTTTSGGSTTP